MYIWLETLSKLIILLVPTFILEKIVSLLVSMRSYAARLHPSTLYSKLKHWRAVRAI